MNQNNVRVDDFKELEFIINYLTITTTNFGVMLRYVRLVGALSIGPHPSIGIPLTANTRIPFEGSAGPKRADKLVNSS